MKKADLHIHTNFSDGTYSTQQLLEEAENIGLNCIAITDHDTVAAVVEALKFKTTYNVEVLPAVEFSCEYEKKEVHILGYLIDYLNKELLEQLEQVRKSRIERVYAMAERLKDKLGIELDPQEVFLLAKNATVSRMHVAYALVKSGVVNTTQEAFLRCIGDTAPGYVTGFKFSVQQAIALIRRVGGIAVLAHPYTIGCDDCIKEFAKMGLAGLEVYYSEHTQGMINFYRDLANDLGLLITGGSDFHGAAKPDIVLGSFTVDYELVERLKAAQIKQIY
ncbi:MAG: PHP domain-containing protein [Candidatus Omnitrophica bacterium]|nr:PHP domain-containing protein [Candidatus Omnitrophota bacterium]